MAGFFGNRGEIKTGGGKKPPKKKKKKKNQIWGVFGGFNFLKAFVGGGGEILGLGVRVGGGGFFFFYPEKLLAPPNGPFPWPPPLLPPLGKFLSRKINLKCAKTNKKKALFSRFFSLLIPEYLAFLKKKRKLGVKIPKKKKKPSKILVKFFFPQKKWKIKKPKPPPPTLPN